MLRLIDCFPLCITEVILASNPMTFFCFDKLTQAVKSQSYLQNLLSLNLSNTKIQDKNAIELFEVVAVYSCIEDLDLSRNPHLSFKFSSHCINQLRGFQMKVSLKRLDLSYCGVSQMHQTQIKDLLKMSEIFWKT